MESGRKVLIHLTSGLIPARRNTHSITRYTQGYFVFSSRPLPRGSDQHRGWFHSSLLTSCMLNGKAPYKALLTHGFVVDGQGKKMSKSQGNVISPQEICNKYGADILRLWTASTDYSGELNISETIIQRTIESYRRIRTHSPFLLEISVITIITMPLLQHLMH